MRLGVFAGEFRFDGYWLVKSGLLDFVFDDGFPLILLVKLFCQLFLASIGSEDATSFNDQFVHRNHIFESGAGIWPFLVRVCRIPRFIFVLYDFKFVSVCHFRSRETF